MMNASVTLRAVADCPFGPAQDYATTFLHNEARRIVVCHAGPVRFVVPGRGWTAARPDLTERGMPHDELLLTWEPAVPFVPAFQIIIRFRIAWLTTAITLHAEGLPECFTRVVLNDLLERMRRHLEEEERQYRLEHPPALGVVSVPASFLPAAPIPSFRLAPNDT